VKLRLTLLRGGRDSADVTVTADSTVTVGDVAAALERSDPAGSAPGQRPPGAVVTLRTHPGGAHGAATVVDAGAVIPTSGIRSGMTVSLASVTDRWQSPGSVRGPAAATLTVLSGPDSGRGFPLPEGTSYLGRGNDADVRLSDPLISKRHARITVTDTVEITDMGSANGLMIGGVRVPRAVLRPQDSVIVGDTAISITSHLNPAAVAVGSSADVNFNRSPRLDPTYSGERFVAPDPPEPPQPHRLPILAMVAPLIMGAVMYAVTRSVMSIVFVGLSPLLMIGNYIDNLVTGRRTAQVAAAQFSASVRAMTEDIDRALAAERAGRLAETPSTADAIDAMRRQTPLLWTRRAEHERFLTARLGVGTLPSRQTVELPSKNKTKPEHWRALAELAAHAATVDGVPVVVDVRDCGAVGVAGPKAAATGVARAIVAQFVALHSPADLTITALVPVDGEPDWEWLKWLPHCGSPHSPLDGSHLGSTAQAATVLVSELEELIADRRGSGQPAASDDSSALPAVLLIVQQGVDVERARLVQLCETGPEAGVYVLWVATAQEQLPAACRDFVVVDPVSGAVAAGFVKTALGVTPLQCETVDPASAQASSRALAPVADAGARVEDDSDLPQSISLLTLLGPELATDPTAVIERWQESVSITDRSGRVTPRRRPPGLRAVIGQTSSGPMTVDLRSQGPHALVGGTTGAGKSEFLQAWVLGLAAGYSPDALTFLFVDYKGGAAFADCIQLPHTVGLVTDLSPHLVQRALTSLNAELHHRERILQSKKAKDVLELQRRGDPDAPPSLLIVVDEFAALVQEVPEFVDGVVNVAQRGRSLGLHLILATQRPAGVIKDNLRANTNLRIALRMADEDDSTDVLGVPLAASFSPDIPGRAAAKTGPGRITNFQTGYAGGWTSDEPPPAQLEIRELTFGPGRQWEEPDGVKPTVDGVQRGPTDIARLVAAIAKAAEQSEIPAPRKPWLPDLASVYDLQFLGQRRDTEIALGVLDEPQQQQQRTVFFNPDIDGNMAIFGTGGAGKSTALRTVAIAASITPRSGPCQVYGMDFGTSGLRMLEDLPHVGSIVSGDDAERITRLINWLREVVDERSDRYAKVRAGTITEYRELSGNRDEPRILLLVDGLATFRDDYEFNSRSGLFTAFTQIAAAGRPVGVHVVVTADRPNTVPSALNSTIQRRLVLRLADENDYMLVDVDADTLTAASPPGRGVLDGLDVQVAVFGGLSNVAEQAKAIERLAGTLQARNTPRAPEIKRLPEIIHAGDLPAMIGSRVTIGMADDSLAAVGIDPVGTFLLCGPPGSGRTTALVSLVQACQQHSDHTRAYYFGNKRSPLPRALTWQGQAVDPDEVAELARTVVDEMVALPPSVFVIEGLTDFLSGPAEMPLQDLVRVAKTTDHLLIAESETSTLAQSWPLVQAIRAARRGFALQPDQTEGDSIFRTSFPRISRSEFPLGRGMLVEGGKIRRVQLILPE